LSYSYGGSKVSAVGSSGKIIPGVRARVVKADGTLAGEGEPGELVAYSPSLALGYYNNEEAYVFFYPNRNIALSDRGTEPKRHS
jgi:acyl-coenzyme A synthetase/AMP-(fatty) acid ligase